jgi:ankyrin repeat/IBR domain-containing protein 1
VKLSKWSAIILKQNLNRIQGRHASALSEKTLRLRENSRFVHFYTRYKNHENSWRMEEPLLHSAKRKRELLQFSLAFDSSRANHNPAALAKSTKFYEDGVWELLKASE